MTQRKREFVFVVALLVAVAALAAFVLYDALGEVGSFHSIFNLR